MFLDIHPIKIDIIPVHVHVTRKSMQNIVIMPCFLRKPASNDANVATIHVFNYRHFIATLFLIFIVNVCEPTATFSLLCVNVDICKFAFKSMKPNKKRNRFEMFD